MKTDWFGCGVLVVFVVIAVVAVYLHFWGPCEAFRLSPTRDVPARCLSYFR